jgi:L-2-hydroxyglutarate oxidase LhgO
MRAMESVDAVVVGAGVVGLACGRALALAGREVLVLEAAATIGTGVSSRSSEVIHAGIYYPAGSLKARLGVRGRHLLYEYCASRGVPHRRCGKLIVATTDGQDAQLLELQQRGARNGVDDLVLIDRGAAIALEPALACTAALLSPSSGIVDTHALMLAIQGDLEAAGGAVVTRTRVRGGRLADGGVQLTTEDGTALQARLLVNCAGLGAQALAHAIEGVPSDRVPPLHLAKGNYFSIARRSPFRHLIYPVPEAAGLGVHLTLDLAGQARFGPDVEWIKHENYDVDPARSSAFYAEIRKYWPDLPEGSLEPAYAGIRPKVQGPGETAADFVIAGPEAHGRPGIVQLFGIESPGITASLAIAEHVAALAGHL